MSVKCTSAGVFLATSATTRSEQNSTAAAPLAASAAPRLCRPSAWCSRSASPAPRSDCESGAPAGRRTCACSPPSRSGSLARPVGSHDGRQALLGGRQQLPPLAPASSRLRILSTCPATVSGSLVEPSNTPPDSRQRAQQPEPDQQGAALPVLAVAPALRQRAGMPLEVAGNEVVGRRAPECFPQMASCQSLFDAPLTPHQPVHRHIRLTLVDRIKVQHPNERGDCRLWM